MAAALSEFITSSAPILRAWHARASAWAAEASWKRIALLGFVIFIAASIIGDIVGFDETTVVDTVPSKAITINIHDDPSGITLMPMVGDKPGRPIHIPGPPKVATTSTPPSTPPASSTASSAAPSTAPSPASGTAQPPAADSDKPRIEATDDSLRFDAGGKHVVIDSEGVHVTKDGAAAPATPAPPATAAPGAEAAPGKTAAEAERARVEEARAAREQEQAFRDEVRSAVDDAKDELQESIAKDLKSSVKHTTVRREGLASLWDFFKVLLTVAFAYLIAVKISANTKRRADAMVQSASQMAERESLQRQVVEARMQMMQAQVEPHFLFNTLASVDYLIETDPARASTMQKNLIQYLRAALPQMRESGTTLGREADLVRAYLDILKVRMEERLQVVVDVPEGLRSAEFPPMMLQSLVENAIKHGLEPKAEGGSIRVQGEVVDGDLCVSVTDTGLGFKPEGAPTSGGGVGLSNIRERLKLLYGNRARFTVQPNRPAGTRVAIVMPYLPVVRRNPSNETAEAS